MLPLEIPDIETFIRYHWSDKETEEAKKALDLLAAMDVANDGELISGVCDYAADRFSRGLPVTNAHIVLAIRDRNQSWDPDNEGGTEKCPYIVTKIMARIILQHTLVQTSRETMTIRRCPADVIFADLPQVQRLYEKEFAKQKAA